MFISIGKLILKRNPQIGTVDMCLSSLPRSNNVITNIDNLPHFQYYIEKSDMNGNY